MPSKSKPKTQREPRRKKRAINPSDLHENLLAAKDGRFSVPNLLNECETTRYAVHLIMVAEEWKAQGDWNQDREEHVQEFGIGVLTQEVLRAVRHGDAKYLRRLSDTVAQTRSHLDTLATGQVSRVVHFEVAGYFLARFDLRKKTLSKNATRADLKKYLTQRRGHQWVESNERQISRAVKDLGISFPPSAGN